MLKNPVSQIMTKDLLTLGPEDNLLQAKEIFENNKVHHIPVVNYRKLLGLISKSDFLLYVNSTNDERNLDIKNDQKLAFTKAKQLMVSRLGKLEPHDRIEVAIDIFLENYFHCLPVVEGEDLVGIVTPFDILKYVSIQNK